MSVELKKKIDIINKKIREMASTNYGT